MTHIEKTDLSGDNIEHHLQLALEQSAMHNVHLAVARWVNGYCNVETTTPTCQSCWYAQAHTNFENWLAAGGFAQSEPEPEPVPVDASALPAVPTESTIPRDTGCSCIA